MKGRKQYMGAELYNKTNTVKLLPKFNYKGKFKLYPGKPYPIEEYMVSFYRPYEKIGVTIRHTISKSLIEKEVKKVIDNLEAEKLVNNEEEIVEVEATNQVSNSAESVNIDKVESTEDEEREEALREVIEKEAEEREKELETPNIDVVDEPTNQVKVYSEVELEGLKISSMKEILDERGVSYQGLPNKRSEYVNLVLSTQ